MSWFGRGFWWGVAVLVTGVVLLMQADNHFWPALLAHPVLVVIEVALLIVAVVAFARRRPSETDVGKALGGFALSVPLVFIGTIVWVVTHLKGLRP
jgi:hypothetical protein